ncbi:MAG: hypothetical protein DHS20C20_29310 [Ardenticatenaceae bacterium]|nr:MAG: hypothetical protein DHS20C20_29310 [Ardenticatenaceae bacterium]
MTTQTKKATIDWLTTIAIAGIAISLTIAIHEGFHALACIAVGGNLLEYSALHVQCSVLPTAPDKFVAGSAAIGNILLGLAILAYLRSNSPKTSELKFFLWLFMLMNWMNGAGYLMFSGIANVADWAEVIQSWEPPWLWRTVLTVVGTGLYTLFVWLALAELGKIIGGTEEEQISRAVKLGLISYATAVFVVLGAGFFSPFGMSSLAVVAGLIGIVAGMSPLLWMMQWFRAKMFVKLQGQALAIQRQWRWIIVSVVVVLVYVVILGRTIYF